jgi:hypothetical protein
MNSELPDWGLLVMWASTMVGAWFLSKEMLRRFG